jgi:multiple sugar transport system substrate-binding protein
MRRILMTIFAIACLMVVTAPMRHASAANTGASAIHGTINYWNAYGNGNSAEAQALTTKVIPAFEKLYPGIHVNNLSLPYDGFFTKLLTALAGGTGPDLIRSDIIWVPQLANIHALVPLDKTSWFKSYAKQVYPGTLSTNYFKGHYFGLPLDTNTRVLIYNKTVFKDAGIASPPTTTAQFVADSAKIKALGGGHYGYAEGGTGAWNILPWIWSFGGSITDKRYRTAAGYLNDKGTVAAIKFLVDLYHQGYLSPSILGGGLSTTDCIGKDLCGMILDGPWMVPIFQASYPDLQFGMSLVPKGPGSTSHSVVGGEDVVEMSQSHNKPATEAFIRFLLSPQAQIWMGDVGQMPVLKALTGSKKLPSYFSVFAKQLKLAEPRTPSPHWNTIDGIISDAVTKALHGDSSPQSAMNDAARQVDGLLR